MTRQSENKGAGFFSLAFGSSSRWSIDINEALGSDNEWSMELDGPTVYLVIQLAELAIIPTALEFLQAKHPQRTWTESTHTLKLGKFGSASVELRWDDEEPPNRCFLAIFSGGKRKSTLYLTLFPEDIEMLKEAFQQVVAKLSEELVKPKESRPVKRSR